MAPTALSDEAADAAFLTYISHPDAAAHAPDTLRALGLGFIVEALSGHYVEARALASTAWDLDPDLIDDVTTAALRAYAPHVAELLARADDDADLAAFAATLPDLPAD